MLRVNPLTTPSVKIHTQSTECAVKQVTEAAMSVVGPDARDGYISARAQHREFLPVFKTNKKKFYLLFYVNRLERYYVILYSNSSVIKMLFGYIRE